MRPLRSDAEEFADRCRLWRERDARGTGFTGWYYVLGMGPRAVPFVLEEIAKGIDLPRWTEILSLVAQLHFEPDPPPRDDLVRVLVAIAKKLEDYCGYYRRLYEPVPPVPPATFEVYISRPATISFTSSQWELP
jgi:hypothetical protein